MPDQRPKATSHFLIAFAIFAAGMILSFGLCASAGTLGNSIGMAGLVIFAISFFGFLITSVIAFFVWIWRIARK